MSTTNDDDLYGDLEHTVAKPQPKTTANAPVSTSFSTSSLPDNKSPSEILQMQRQIQSLKEERDTLQKNIGILYRTAKAELQRKDRTINQLQDEVDSLRR